MENKIEETLWEKLKSKYVIKNIFKYIKDKNYKYKLVKYSKKSQKFLETDYKRRIIKNNIKLYVSENFNNKFFLEFKGNSIDELMSRYRIEDREKLKKYLSKAIIQFINNKIKDDEDYGKNFYISEIPIYIDNIFFNDLIEEKFFSELFTIIVVPANIPKAHLLLLKEKNVKYSSIRIIYNDVYRLNYFDELNINFEQIKKLGFYGKNLSVSNYRKFFEKFFSMKNLQNNLIYLNIGIKSHPIYPNNFESINDFKSLEQLHLIRFRARSPLILELETLKILSLKNCDNIVLGKKCCKNLKEFSIDCSKNINNGSILVLPKLESFKVHLDPNFKYKSFSKIIDFKSSKDLKYLIADPYDFINTDNKNLVDLKLRQLNNYKTVNEKKLLKKLIEMPCLKNVDIELIDIKDGDFDTIKETNNSVEMININFGTDRTCKFYNLEKKFINLKNLTINSYLKNAAIKEDKDCKVTKFEVIGGGEFYINSFENLIKASFHYCEIFPKLFPFFSSENKYEFKSLVSLELMVEELDFFILENILKNIDNSPKLEELVLNCKLKDFNENKYKEFIINLLSKKLRIINITVYQQNYDSPKFYSNDELKLICPSFLEYKYKKLQIQKVDLIEEKNIKNSNISLNINASYYHPKNSNQNEPTHNYNFQQFQNNPNYFNNYMHYNYTNNNYNK